jgi:hypothetical protein
MIQPDPDEDEASQSKAGSDHHALGQARGEEDAVIARLQKYDPNFVAPPAREPGMARVLSHWAEQVGSDPWQYSWKPDHEKQLDWEMKQKKRQQEAKQRKRAERKAAFRRVKEEAAGGGGGGPSTQPLPLAARYSQASADAGPSQQPTILSSVPSQVMSQPLAGPHGGRAPTGRKKLKTGPGRMAGFK